MTERAQRERGARKGELVLLALGGAGEIGMNLYLYGFGPADDRRWIMVDCGVKFGDERDPGIDVILPDTAFIEGERHNLDAIILTHGHEDHLGAVAWLWPRLKAPVYATAFTAALLRNKLQEARLLDEVPLHVVPMGHRFTVGSFDIEYLAVTHSIPESNALVLRTPAGAVLHSGDWKIDRTPTIGAPIDEARFRALGDEGCRAFVCDSTNILRDGFSPSEAEIADGIARIIAQGTRRVAVTTFASHVARIEAVSKAAQAAGRQVVVAGRALNTVIEAARSTGYLQEVPQLLPEDVFREIPAERCVLLVTGSQGEPRAALARIAANAHPNVTLEEGDVVVFSSRTIPGNEKAVSEVQNGLAARGVRIVTSEDALVHASGHPRRGEVRQMVEWLRPGLLVPMHGEMRHLSEHARHAREFGVPEAVVIGNGDVLRLAPGPAEIVDEAPWGRLHVDGNLIVPSVDGPARFRRKLAFSGIVVVALAFDRKLSLADDPQVVLDGLPAEDRDGDSLHEIVYDAVDRALETMPRNRRRDDESVTDGVRAAVRRAAFEAWGKKPICHVLIQRV